MVLHSGLSAERAARLVGLFYIGITVGRAVSGFMTTALGDARMIRLGQAVILAGCAALLLPIGWSVQTEPLPVPDWPSDGQRLCGHLPDAACIWRPE